MTNYPDNMTTRAYDAAQGRDEVPDAEEPPYNEELARKYLAYLIAVKREEVEMRNACERLRILGRVG